MPIDAFNVVCCRFVVLRKEIPLPLLFLMFAAADYTSMDISGGNVNNNLLLLSMQSLSSLSSKWRIFQTELSRLLLTNFPQMP